ncbi:MAG: hypothetical protein HND59_08650 [Pseudomonadota bacterium]|nr:MAG: hypothetical protein HND59_08650 [Pseudomonadota bacterium]
MRLNWVNATRPHPLLPRRVAARNRRAPAIATQIKPSSRAQAGPQPEPPTRPVVPRQSAAGPAMAPALPAPGIRPGSTPSGSPGGFGSAPPRGAAETIREAAAGIGSRPVIDRVTDSDGLSCSRRDFTVTGRNFGAEAGSRRLMFMTPVRHTPIRAVFGVYSWSDGRITAQLPERSFVLPGQRYVVAMVDERNNPISNTTRELRVCPTQFTAVGDIRVTNCGAGAGNVRVRAFREGRQIGSTMGQGVPGNDFAIRYEMNLPPSTSSDEVELRPELVGITCTGGAWVPERGTVRLSYDQSRATRAFEFRVGMQTRRIAMRIVSGLVQSAFNGTQIRINNYDPATRRTRENDSFVRLSDALGGTERRFNIGPAVSGPRKYYINDINLASTRVLPAENELRVAMVFESNGTELIGTCGQDGWDLFCGAGAPDVQASIAVDIFFTLDRYYSRTAPISLSFSRVRVVPNVDAQADGLCRVVDLLCSAISDYRGLIRTIVESSFMNVLDTPAVRDQVAIALLPSLRGLRIGTLNSVRIEGNDLVLAYLTDFE